MNSRMSRMPSTKDVPFAYKPNSLEAANATPSSEDLDLSALSTASASKYYTVKGKLLIGPGLPVIATIKKKVKEDNAIFSESGD